MEPSSSTLSLREAQFPLSPMVIRELADGERVVTVETVTAELTITGEDADRCQDILARHRDVAAFGADAAAELTRIRRALTEDQGSSA